MQLVGQLIFILQVHSNPVKIVPWEKQKRAVLVRRLSSSPKFLERVFLDINSPSAPTPESKKHWLLIIEDSTDYASSFFKEKS